jgi:hypothetical protein
MNMRRTLVVLAIVIASASIAAALNPDDELWIPAAGRGPGESGSFWMTDLYLMNIGAEPVTVEIAWLERDADNSDAEGVEFEIGAEGTLVLEDVISTVFGQETASGAFHVEVVEEEPGKIVQDDDPKLIASARIYNVDDDETFGQGFEGIIEDAAISADDEDPTHAVGVSDNASFRSNWYGLNISVDDQDLPVEAEVLVEVLDLAGEVVASATFTMAPFAPMLRPVSDLGAGDLDHATLRFTMLEGEGIFGASKVDELSNDPTTLEAHWDCSSEDSGEEEFTDEFFIEDCTFVNTGSHPYYIPLEPGTQLRFEGDDDGELVELRITVLEDTEMVDGVETRVVEEHETVDGELVEISRNFFAICVETNSFFYFGEDVDIYEDGQVVSHEGAWRAGVDGARAGIIMPGTVLLGSRYYQEVAPGVAEDRAEHIAMDATVETPAGTFTDCLQVDETTPMESGVSLKMYAPGVGLVQDDVLYLTGITEP